jgi:hypothetical protein
MLIPKEDKGMSTALLFLVHGMDEENQKAEELLNRNGIEYVVEPCGPTMAQLYRCPFIRDEEERNHYGLDGIQFWLSRRSK